jgi:hypothetical protein
MGIFGRNGLRNGPPPCERGPLRDAPLLGCQEARAGASHRGQRSLARAPGVGGRSQSRVASKARSVATPWR